MQRSSDSLTRTLRAPNSEGMRVRQAQARRRIPRLVLMACLAALTVSQAFLPSAQAGAGHCRVPSNAYPTIQAAVNNATCATINVAARTYPELVTIGRNVAIRGEGEDSTIVDGGGRGPVLRIASGMVTITGVTIQNGVHDRIFDDQSLDLVSDGLGGGIYNRGMLTVQNCLVANNAGYNGGGIANFGMLTIRNSTLVDNSAFQDGGGIANSGTAIVRNSTIAGNSAHAGGGIYIEFGHTLTVENSTIADNSAVVAGGIHNNVGQLTIRNSTISGNSADVGGGILSNAGPLTVENSTIAGNSADVGGGILNGGVGATATLTNSTLIGNSADFGGGILNESVGVTATLTNSTLIGNTAGFDGGGIYNTDGATVTLMGVTFENNTPNDCAGCPGLL